MARTVIAGLFAVRRFALITMILFIEACAMVHANKPKFDPDEIEEMAHILEQRDGQVLMSPEFGHPLMDSDPEIRRRRFQSVADFQVR